MYGGLHRKVMFARDRVIFRPGSESLGWRQQRPPPPGRNAPCRPKRACAQECPNSNNNKTARCCQQSRPFAGLFALPCIIVHTALTNHAALTSARCQFSRCGCAAPPLPNQIVVSWDRQSPKLRGVVIKPGQPFSTRPISAL